MLPLLLFACLCNPLSAYAPEFNSFSIQIPKLKFVKHIKPNDSIIYLIVFGFFFIVLRIVISFASKSLDVPKPRHKIDEFIEENGYSFDYGFVFKVVVEEDKTDMTDFQRSFSMKKVVDRLQKAGFETECFYSCQRDEIYVKFRMKMNRLKYFADKINYKLQLNVDRLQTKAAAGKPGVWARITIVDTYRVSPYRPTQYIYGAYNQDPDLESLFETYKIVAGKVVENKYEIEKIVPFRPVDRLKLIAMILEAKVMDGGCGFYLENLLEKKAVLAVMPLHDYVALNAVQRQWLKLLAYPDDTPTTKETNPDPDSDYKSLVCKIKDYFGEQIGLYFLFLIYMTKALVVPGVLGAGAYVVQKIFGGPENVVYPPFAVFMMIWSTVFVDYWKRKQSTAAMEWGVVGFESEEADRPTFKGIHTTSIVDGTPWTYFPEDEKLKRSRMISVVILFFNFLVVASVFISFVVKWVLQQSMASSLVITFAGVTFDTLEIIIPVLNAIVIQTSNWLYSLVVYSLNDYENHRTQTDYEDSLIGKIFIFQLINSYSCLVYVAFIEHPFLGLACNISHNCTEEAATTLATVFIIRQLSIIFFDIFWRKINIEMKNEKETSGLEPGMVVSHIEEQYILDEYNSLKNGINDYASLVGQYGYTVLFVAAFPLAATLSLAAGYIQIRVDGWKMCQAYRRPIPRTAEDIGKWQDMLEIISVLGVVSNMGLIFFTGTYANNLQWPMRWIFFIICEHTLFVLKVAVQSLIDDVPDEVEMQIKRNDFLVDKVLRDKPDDEEDNEDVDNDRPVVAFKVELTDTHWILPLEVEGIEPDSALDGEVKEG